MSNHTPQKRQIIVGVDGSPNSEKAVDWAVAYAHAGDTVTLVSAWSPVIVPVEMAMSYTFDDTGARTILDSENKRIAKAAAGRDITVNTQDMTRWVYTVKSAIGSTELVVHRAHPKSSSSIATAIVEAIV